MTVLLNLVFNQLKGVVMIGIIKKVISLLLTKEKMIGYGVGIAVAVAAAALDMQPKELRDSICSQYSAQGK